MYTVNHRSRSVSLKTHCFLAFVLLFCAGFHSMLHGQEAEGGPVDRYANADTLINGEWRSFTAVPDSLGPHALDSLALAVEQSLDRFSGGARESEEFSKYQLAKSYLMLGRIALLQGKYARALAYTRTAQDFDELQAAWMAFLLEARCWRQFGRNDEARTAFFTAWSMGGNAALDSLRRMFIEDNQSERGFGLWLQLFAETALKRAPLFEATSLDGTVCNLRSYRGKTVVLTFWFIGCPGCEIEREAMNRLAKKYHDSDVVFIALLCRDGDASLRAYLAQAPYHARHITAAQRIAEQYSVHAFPTHVIIDTEGRIFSTLLGGSDEKDAIIEESLDRCRLLTDRVGQ